MKRLNFVKMTDSDWVELFAHRYFGCEHCGTIWDIAYRVHNNRLEFQAVERKQKVGKAQRKSLNLKRFTR